MLPGLMFQPHLSSGKKQHTHKGEVSLQSCRELKWQFRRSLYFHILLVHSPGPEESHSKND